MENNQELKEETKPQEQKSDNQDLSKVLESAFEKINKRLDDIEKNRFSSQEIKNIAAQNVISKEIKQQEEFLNIEKHNELINKGKTALEIRNLKWDAVLQRFLNNEVSQSEIMQATTGARNDKTDLLSLALFRYLAPSKGISIEQLNKISITGGERDFEKNNSFQRIVMNSI